VHYAKSSENFIDALAPRMDQHQMHFLDTGRLSARHRNDIVGRGVDQSRRARQRDGNAARAASGLESALDVFRTTAGRESDGDIAGTSERLDLALEQGGVSEIVRDASDGSRITRERDGRQRTPTLEEAADQLTGEMTGLGGAATVAECDDLIALLQRLDEHALDRSGNIMQLDHTLPYDLLVRGEVVGERRS